MVEASGARLRGSVEGRAVYVPSGCVKTPIVKAAWETGAARAQGNINPL